MSSRGVTCWFMIKNTIWTHKALSKRFCSDVMVLVSLNFKHLEKAGMKVSADSDK